MKLDKQAVSDSFNKVATGYQKSAFFQEEVASRLLERLELMNVKPKTILDAGCGTGFCTRLLDKKFSKAKTCGVDIAPAMIDVASKQKKLFGKIEYQVADVEKLPFESNQFDLVFSNLTAQWVGDLKTMFSEFNRVLKPKGLLIFSTLGLDTLTELKQSWQGVDQKVHVHDFLDMHVIGDLVHTAQFENTVMDRDVITLTYKTMKGLMNDLKAVGANNRASNRQRGLYGKSKFQNLENAYQKFRWQDGQLPATFEVVYGHAWKKKEASEGDYHTYPVKVR